MSNTTATSARKPDTLKQLSALQSARDTLNDSSSNILTRLQAAQTVRDVHAQRTTRKRSMV